MKTMPESTIIPVLTYSDIDKAITWLTETFGFKERWRIGTHRAQLSHGNGTFVVTRGLPNPVSLLVRVKNIDNYFTKSKLRGVKIISEPANYFYGERQYTVEDIGGHIWTLSETVKEITPEEWGATSKTN